MTACNKEIAVSMFQEFLRQVQVWNLAPPLESTLRSYQESYSESELEWDPEWD